MHTHPIEGLRKFQGREDRKAKFFKELYEAELEFPGG